MNQLHPNDKRNASKHRKMVRRKASHPRAGEEESTVSFKPGQTAGKRVIRNTGWCA